MKWYFTLTKIFLRKSIKICFLDQWSHDAVNNPQPVSPFYLLVFCEVRASYLKNYRTKFCSFWVKKAQNGLKVKFFKFCEKLMLKTFDILLQVIVVQRLIIDLDDFFFFFFFFFFWGLWGKRGMKWAQKKVFQVLSNITTWDFAWIIVA